MSRAKAYRHKERYPKFRAAWDEALELSIELLETHVRGRAFNDARDPQSATLAMFLLKAHRPHKYRDNVKPEPDLTAAELTEEAERRAIERKAQRERKAH